MTAFQITFICLFSFVTFLFLCFVVAAIKVWLRIAHFVKNIEHKVDKLDHALDQIHHRAEHMEYDMHNRYESDHLGTTHLLDIASQLVAAVTVGMDLWKKYRRGRR